ncbi:MAG: hypothetical protein GY719_42555 [bacterium]|nr:hypothetical protein [bacterium]
MKAVTSILWSPDFPIVVSLLLAGLITLAIARFGVLTLVAYWLNFFLLFYMPTAVDLSSWHAESTVLAVGLTMALGAWGTWAAVGGRPLFGRETVRG